MNLTNYRRLLH